MAPCTAEVPLPATSFVASPADGVYSIGLPSASRVSAEEYGGENRQIARRVGNGVLRVVIDKKRKKAGA